MMNARRNLCLLGLLAFWCSSVLPTLAFYDPGLGRWITRDPVAEHGFRLLDPHCRKASGADPTPYAFALNSPTLHVDHVGLTVDLFCGYRAGKAAVPSALSYYPKVKVPPLNDDLQHCYVGCQIAKLCNQETATAAGVIVEIESLLKSDTGQAESRDILNTRYGAEVCGQDSSCRTCCENARSTGELDTIQ
jgi:hypothetical protein